MRAFLTLALAIVAMMCLLESCGESTGEAPPRPQPSPPWNKPLKNVAILAIV